MKMRKQYGKWIVEDRGVNKVFDTSADAWGYVFLMREIRPKAPQVPRSLYPVRSLLPFPERRVKRVAWKRIYP